MHFKVIIIGEDPEEQLAPFSEHIKMPRYKTGDVSQESIDNFIELYTTYDKDRGYGAENQTQAEENKKLSVKELYEKYGDNWNSKCWKEEKDGKWGEYYTYNPHSKWDWYEQGGRYAGSIKVKEGVEPGAVNFSWGWDEKEKKKVEQEGRCDQAFKSEIANLDTLCGYAILNDGEWLENEGYEEGEWEKKVAEILNSLSDETLISIYDCHI